MSPPRPPASRRLWFLALLLLAVCATPGRALAQTSTERQIEQEVFALTNQFRAQHGLSILRPDARLTACARQHSAEMIRLNYFSHRSPVAGYVTVSDRAHEAGITDLACGENLASMRGYAPSQLPEAAMRGWIASPGHLANLMRPSYTHLGVGCVISGNQCMITQNFGEPLLVYNNGQWTPASTSVTRPPPYHPVTPVPHPLPPRTVSESTRQIEDQLLSLINQARRDAGLGPLSSDNRLRQAAIDHDAEMLALHYFSHTSPISDHATVEDRVHFYNVSDLEVYENIGQMRGYAPTTLAEAAFKGFMGSAPNRENILRPGVTTAGIGVVTSQGTAMICIVFGAPPAQSWHPPFDWPWLRHFMTGLYIPAPTAYHGAHFRKRV